MSIDPKFVELTDDVLNFFLYNTILKQVEPIDSIWTDCCYTSGPNTTSPITGKYEMIVIELAEFLSEWWFALSTNTARADQSDVRLDGAGWYGGKGSNEMSACRGVRGYEKTFSSTSSASCPIFSSFKYLEGFSNRGWTLFCGAGVVYKPQPAKASTACGVVSTREMSVFVPCLLELMVVGRISGTAVEPNHHGCASERPPRLLVNLLPFRHYDLHSQSRISQCE